MPIDSVIGPSPKPQVSDPPRRSTKLPGFIIAQSAVAPPIRSDFATGFEKDHA